MSRRAEEPQGPGVPQPPGPCRPGYIPCAVCTEPINYDEYRSARVWTDPDGLTVAAHQECLVRLGETDLELRS